MGEPDDSAGGTEVPGPEDLQQPCPSRLIPTLPASLQKECMEMQRNARSCNSSFQSGAVERLCPPPPESQVIYRLTNTSDRHLRPKP